VYFDELVRHAELDTLADGDLLAPAAAAAAAHSNHSTPVSLRQPYSQHCSLSPEAVMSPTDLSMRRDRSTAADVTSFTSPSSGFDSPSMHAAGQFFTARQHT